MIEGLGRVDDPNDDYEAVDVAEYIGGDNLDTASRVVMSQLKYSTRHADKAWTVSRICEKKTKRTVGGNAQSPRSVIADLAGIYAKLLTEKLAEELRDKVRISLVSNQPGDPLLLAAVAAAADWTRTSRPPGAGKAKLLQALDAPHSDAVQKLAEAVGTRLGSKQFCDFLAVLDLSQTGTLSRTALARGVLAGAAELVPGRGPDSARRLFDLVRREALPDSQRSGIRAEDVLAELGVADPLDLYPAPARLAPLVDPLPAPGAEVVVDAVRTHPGSLVVAAGPAGVGKTTALRQLADHLPHGSVVVIFDCYGGGEYLSSGEERHTAQRFVTQVVNDLAQQCGTPLLVHAQTFEEDLWRRLRRTLEAAADALDPGAVLVLAVDAADNAAFAAQSRGDRGFLPALLALPLPSHVTIVLTARSHRVESLGASGAAQVELAPFDADTSAAHLRRYRADATEADAAEFHERTEGNPRTQYYALNRAAAENLDMPALLKACARTPDELFKELVDSALRVSGVDAGGQKWLSLMLALARPVSTATLAAALGVDPAAVVAFAHGLTPGVTVTDGAIQFRDEDFETYVRGQVDPASVIAAHDQLADMFLTTRAADADAAAHVADHLYAAGRLADVLRLALDEKWPEAIPDGLRRAEAQGRRLDLAARAAAQMTDNAADAVRLAAQGCDAASQLENLSWLVDARLDLVALYADVDLLRTYVLRQATRTTWLAPVHMRLAAALSRRPERHAAARAELERADAWLRRWKASPPEETRDWHIDPDEVACAAEALYRLDGPATAIAHLRRWRPAEFALEAAAAFAARVAAEEDPQQVKDALHQYKVPLAAQAPFLAYVAWHEAAPDQVWVDQVVNAVIAVDRTDEQPWHGRLVQVATRYGSRESAVALARHWTRPLPSRRWGFRSGDVNGVAALRVQAIAAALESTGLSVGDLLPERLRPEREESAEGTDHKPISGDDPHAHERREWSETVGPLVPAAVLAARAAIGEVSATDVASFVAAGLAERTERAGHRWFAFDRSYRAWSALVADAAVDSAASLDVIDRLANVAPMLLRGDAPHHWLELAAGLVARSVHTERAAELCQRVSAYIASHEFPARDRLELLARAAEIAGVVEPELGRRLFDQAVDASTGINDEAARMLSVYSNLADRAIFSDAERPVVAARLVAAAEEVAPYVTDSDVIPHEDVARAAGRLHAGIGLAAVSRWDDEDRIRLASTLPAALTGSVDGGGVSPGHALALDHMIEDDQLRLQFLLAVVDRLRVGAAGTAKARVALRRATDWLRQATPARDQPALARQLLNWAVERGLHGNIEADLIPVIRLGREDAEPAEASWGRDLSDEAETLLSDVANHSWTTLASDVAALTEASVYGSRLGNFITAVAHATPSAQRSDALTAITQLVDPAGANTILGVLASCLKRWRYSSGITDWARAMLPTLLTRHLPDLALGHGTPALLDQLRAFGSDADVRHAVLVALPDARPQLTAYGWQKIAALLGQLCGPADAATAVRKLLADRLPESRAGEREADADSNELANSLPLLLWSAFGHPRRDIRWRAAHAARDLLTRADPSASATIATALVNCLDRTDAGPYRSRTLHFYRFSAISMLLTALVRVAAEAPIVLAPHLQALIRHATSQELPHAQIRELARQAAFSVAGPNGPGADILGRANQPTSCLARRKAERSNDSRQLAENRRYDFDTMDTIPYWYAPLARVFDLPVDKIAERAERWIVDEWGLANDDWWNDVRELRDQRSYQRTNNGHGSIPPEENLRLYLEYHAMLAAAGELIDTEQPMLVDSWDDLRDPWDNWLHQYLPASSSHWLADFRNGIPTEPDLFGHVPPIEEWEKPADPEFDHILGLAGGCLPGSVPIAGRISLHRSGAYGETYIRSALVAPAHAVDLQRALAAAENPRDWKLPAEDEHEFEVDHDQFVLRGWLTEPADSSETLEEHDPYAQGIHLARPLPGRQFCSVVHAFTDGTGLTLRSSGGTILTRTEQWADQGDDTGAVTSEGYRVYVDREALTRYLCDTGMMLILEVQIGRHRRNDRTGGWRSPRSRLYLVDPSGSITAR
ncbi:AAA family ATPase [Micromonospora sp. NPDC053740]|uniref:AAA family ATPase n=1 Tax=Micromonospora sp. NPDC053740 TaxID=3155173 RepID=UPI003423A430